MAWLLLLAASLAMATDGRVGVTVLPAHTSGGVSSVAAAQLTATGSALLVAAPSYRLEPLGDEALERLAQDAPCRELASCLATLLPRDTKLVLDPRLELRDGILALDLRLLYEGELVRRHGSSVTNATLPDVIARELPLLLSGWSNEARLYARALGGDERAEATLREHFPASAWVRSLDEERGER